MKVFYHNVFISLLSGVVTYVGITNGLISLPAPTPDTTSALASTVQTSRPQVFNSKLRFVVVVGLEGTGHHYIGKILQNSPDINKFRNKKLIPGLRQLQYMLHHIKDPRNALWNSHCIRSNATVDLSANLQKVANQMHRMERNATRTMPGRKTPVHAAINTVFEQRFIGMLSYPNFEGPCRRLNYPILELFYRACDMASVDCGHVYIYRDPAAIIQSTVINRQFSSSLSEQLHLYNTMYSIIQGQIESFPDRTWGCYGLYEMPGTAPGERPDWWQDFSRLWGWNSVEEFAAYMKTIYKAPKPVDDDVIPVGLEPYRRMVYQAHNRVLNLCRKARAGEVQAVSY